MALRKCKECGKDVSTKAKSCPNCGAIAKKQTSCLTYFVAIFLIYVLIKMFNGSSNYTSQSSNSSNASQKSTISKTRSSESLTADAFTMCQRFVKNELVSPATAEFCSILDAEIKELPNRKFSIYGYVDSQNGFGAVVRTRFICEVQFKNNEWILTDILLQ